MQRSDDSSTNSLQDNERSNIDAIESGEFQTVNNSGLEMEMVMELESKPVKKQKESSEKKTDGCIMHTQKTKFDQMIRSDLITSDIGPFRT